MSTHPKVRSAAEAEADLKPGTLYVRLSKDKRLVGFGLTVGDQNAALDIPQGVNFAKQIMDAVERQVITDLLQTVEELADELAARADSLAFDVFAADLNEDERGPTEDFEPEYVPDTEDDEASEHEYVSKAGDGQGEIERVMSRALATGEKVEIGYTDAADNYSERFVTVVEQNTDGLNYVLYRTKDEDGDWRSLRSDRIYFVETL